MSGSRDGERVVVSALSGSLCIRNGSARGRRRFACRDCGRTIAGTAGTPPFRLCTTLPEIVRTPLIVLRRGSLRAAEEQTGHYYETIAAWIRRIGTHAEDACRGGD